MMTIVIGYFHGCFGVRTAAPRVSTATATCLGNYPLLLLDVMLALVPKQTDGRNGVLCNRCNRDLNLSCIVFNSLDVIAVCAPPYSPQVRMRSAYWGKCDRKIVFQKETHFRHSPTGFGGT